MSKRAAVILISAMCAAALFSGCSGAAKKASRAGAKPALPAEVRSVFTPATSAGELQVLGEWRVKEINRAPVNRPRKADPITMTVDADGRITGFAGVNRYSTMIDPAALAKGEFKLGPVMSTRMAGSKAMMATEAEFFAGLEKARMWKIENGELVITNLGRRVFLRLMRPQ